MQTPSLILASGSPRRREILENLGVRFTVLCADADETSDLTDPCALTEQLSCRKALAVRDLLRSRGEDITQTLLLGADTVVADANGQILGKPHTPAVARTMLRALSGNVHHVISGISLVCGDTAVSAHEVTEVAFDTLSDTVIERYVATGEPLDKAGAYGIQNTAALWIPQIRGDYFNVVGLPVHALESLLQKTFSLSLLDFHR